MCNRVENQYRMMYKEIFNEEFPTSKPIKRNNCTGALSSIADFKIFKKNYKERLLRLKNNSEHNLAVLSSIKKLIQDIAVVDGYKWSGAYSELVALDYIQSFGHFVEVLEFPYKKDVNIAPDSFAKQFGQKYIDLDFKYKLHHTLLYADIKSFVPTHHELFDNVFKQIQKTMDCNDFYISVENLSGGDSLINYCDIISNKLKEGLIAAIRKKEKKYSHVTISGKEYTFKISYPRENGSIAHVSHDTYDPYKAAEKNKYRILRYANKLLIDEPSLLILVVNPWFNKEMSFYNEVFYRALSRRVFFELSRDKRTIKDLMPDYEFEGLKISDVSEKLSGLIFIEDYSINEKTKNLYKSYIYLNPKATNEKLCKYVFTPMYDSHSNYTPIVVDDFEYDNY